MVRVRPFMPEDAPELSARLATLPLLERYGTDRSRLCAWLLAASARGEGVLVAVDEQPLGLVWFQTSGTFGRGGYLRLIAVCREAQGRGVGEHLLAAFEDAVFRESAHAFLLVSDFNTGAQRFYERQGYRKVGALPGFVLPDVSELIYWKARPSKPQR